ncbi:MAG: hypothetical protein NT023_20005 [Armatimonadetes bacterium]|nr:hypothetical protein [Armatimonadota bacterium]
MNTRNIVRRAGLGFALMTLGITVGGVKAQESQGRPQEGNRPPVGFRRGETPPPGRRHEGFPVIPPPIADALNLTDKQKTELMALEKEVNEKIKKILSADQMKKMKMLRERHRPPMGRGPEGPEGGEGRGGRPPREGGPEGRGGRPGGPPPPRDGGPDGRGGRPGGPPPPPRDGGGEGRGEQGPPPPPGDRDEVRATQSGHKRV